MAMSGATRARAAWLSLGISVIFSAAAIGPGCGSGDPEIPAGKRHCESKPAGSDHNQEIGCDLRCPGDPSCTSSDKATFHAGAASEDITPSVEYVVAFAPQNQGNNWFNPLGGDKCVEKGSCDITNVASCTAVDPNLCTWIAGFGAGRPATGNGDPTSVRCAVLARGNTKVGLCAVDSVGWFYNEIEQTRALISADHPELGLDFLLVAATHVHETQDTLGIWGPSDSESGVKDEYQKLIREKTAAALVAANAALEPVHLEFGATVVDGHIAGTDPGGHKTAAFVSDTRDPVVIDAELRTLRFTRPEDGTTVATLINFTSHPEFAGDSNFLTSADYVGTLRDAVENGLEVKSAAGQSLIKTEGFGGVAIFFNGALGGQVGPGKVRHTDFEGNAVPEGLERAYNNGRLLAVYAHEALTKGVDKVETAPLGVRAREIYVDVHNTAYHIAIAQELFRRDAYFFDPSIQLGEDNIPSIKTQIAVIDVGPAEMISVPGELHAELLLATRDGTSALDAPYPFTPKPYFVLNDPATNPNCEKDGYSQCDDGPPAIAQMERSGILDLARDPNAKYRWLLGLGQDEIGYIVPKYDYKVDDQNPYLEEASPGDHYEETNSVGPNVEEQVVGPLLQLLRSPAVIKRPPLE